MGMAYSAAILTTLLGLPASVSENSAASAASMMLTWADLIVQGGDIGVIDGVEPIQIPFELANAGNLLGCQHGLCSDRSITSGGNVIAEGDICPDERRRDFEGIGLLTTGHDLLPWVSAR
jgi:hypothetical protein